MQYGSIAAGYLVKDGKVLLVHHNGFDKWVPPGGHIDDDETPAQCAKREFFEETGLEVTVMSAVPLAFEGDENETPIPVPFHMGLDTEGFNKPLVAHFYFVKEAKENQTLQYQESELFGIGWFSKEDLVGLKTFDQVRAVAAFAIDNYPKE